MTPCERERALIKKNKQLEVQRASSYPLETLFGDVSVPVLCCPALTGVNWVFIQAWEAAALRPQLFRVQP